MISKIKLIALLLICLPIYISGDESLMKQAVAKIKKFATVSQFTLLKTETNRQFHSFEHLSTPYFSVYETTPTKSGIITYLAIYDQSLKTIILTIPSYVNSFNASLTTPGFLNQFKNKQPTITPIHRGKGVDAISGATLSTESLITAVNSSAADLKQLISTQK